MSLRISHKSHLEFEKTHLLEVFKNNDYLRQQGIKAFRNVIKGPKENKDMRNEVEKVYLPFI